MLEIGVLGMFGIGLIELILIAAVVLVVGWGGLSSMVGLFNGVQSGHATLKCPHCGQVTAPTDGRCSSCGNEL